MVNQQNIWHLPVNPYGIVDAYNRMCLALGSSSAAIKAAHADYNGHRIEVSFNTYRQYYTAGYYWAGWNCISRGTFRQTVEEAVKMYRQGALGASVTVSADHGEDLTVLAENGFIQGPQPEQPSFITWRHLVAARCAPDAAHPGRKVNIFDLELLVDAQSEADYFKAVGRKYSSITRP